MAAAGAAGAGSASGQTGHLATPAHARHHCSMENDPPVTHADVQTIMESLFDIRAGVDYLVTAVRGDEDDESEEEEEN